MVFYLASPSKERWTLGVRLINAPLFYQGGKQFLEIRQKLPKKYQEKVDAGCRLPDYAKGSTREAS